jgi:hypothetical protein
MGGRRALLPSTLLLTAKINCKYWSGRNRFQNMGENGAVSPINISAVKKVNAIGEGGGGSSLRPTSDPRQK